MEFGCISIPYPNPAISPRYWSLTARSEFELLVDGSFTTVENSPKFKLFFGLGRLLPPSKRQKILRSSNYFWDLSVVFSVGTSKIHPSPENGANLKESSTNRLKKRPGPRNSSNFEEFSTFRDRGKRSSPNNNSNSEEFLTRVNHPRVIRIPRAQ